MALVKHNNNSISAVTSMASLTTGSMTLIKEQTASSSASISFVDGSSDVVLDSTYPIYKFEYINCHPATDAVHFEFNLSTDSGSTYNVAKTSTYFNAFHKEDDSSTGLTYNAGGDLAQGTGTQDIFRGVGSDNDQSICGCMFLFNPSSTTFVKHFIIQSVLLSSGDSAQNAFVAGYGNTTSAVNGVKFQMSSGNIDAGTIKLYGIKDS